MSRIATAAASGSRAECVAGHVVDELGLPLAGTIVVGLHGGRSLPRRVFRGPARAVFDATLTTRAGRFTLERPPSGAPFYLEVRSHVGRTITTAGPFERGDSPAQLTVSRASLTGWIATGGTLPEPVPGNAVELLLDNHDAWAATVDAVRAAERSINLLLFYLAVGDVFMRFTPDPPVPGTGPIGGDRLETELAAAGQRDVHVRILANDATNPDLPPFLSPDTAYSVSRYFRRKANITVRRFKTPLLTPMHAKVLIVDDQIALSLGSPFVSDYYDHWTHDIDDPRHGGFPAASVFWRAQQIRVPVHDVSLRLRGPVVGVLNETFRMHWNLAGRGLPSLPAAHSPAPLRQPSVTLQVTRTLPGNRRHAQAPHGETTILESYLRAFENARDFIYLENQYFTSHEVADGLIRAVRARPGLQVIVLTNSKVDIPAYDVWHPEAIGRVLSGLCDADRERVAFYTLWSHEAPQSAGGRPRLLRNYVHSKVAIVDDVWATAGSANLDGVSLCASDYSMRKPCLARLMHGFRGGLGLIAEQDRAMEVNVAAVDEADGLNSSAFPRHLRRVLWAEHLGFVGRRGDPDGHAPDLGVRPPGGWLALWKTRTAAKLAELTEGFADGLHPCRALPMPLDGGHPAAGVDDPVRYLSSLGIDNTRLEVLREFRPFSFRTGHYT